MYKLVGSQLFEITFHLLLNHFQILASFLAVAAALPIEDTAEVAAAKAEFNAAFADAEEVAAAKAAFQAAFDDAAAGGLAAKQAPAPVHAIPAPAPPAPPAPVHAIPAPA